MRFTFPPYALSFFILIAPFAQGAFATETSEEGASSKIKSSMVVVQGEAKKTDVAKQEKFTAGEHYVVLDKPSATRDNSKIEVVEMFSYGCPHCYEFEPLIKEWSEQQTKDVDF